MSLTVSHLSISQAWAGDDCRSHPWGYQLGSTNGCLTVHPLLLLLSFCKIRIQIYLGILQSIQCLIFFGGFLNNLSQYKQLHESSNANVVVADGTNDSEYGPFPHPSTRNHERKRGVAWTDEEHKLFLLGLRKADKGDWRGIARDFVKTRTPTQVAAHAYKFFQQSKLLAREELPYRKSALPVAQENQPSDYTGPKEIEVTSVQISAEELVFSPRKSKNLEVVENVSLEVKSDYTRPEEVEATGFLVCPEELVSSPRKSKVLEVVENISLEVKSAYYTAPEEVKATRFQVCPEEELVTSPRKCKVLEAVENISLEIIGCCCVFCEEVMGIY